MKRAICFAVLLMAAFVGMVSAQRPGAQSAVATARTIIVMTEPNAVIWIDEIRRGTTDAGGRLSAVKISSGAHTLRVRASGFKKSSVPLTAAQPGGRMARL